MNKYTLTIRGVIDESWLFDAIGETLREMEEAGALGLLGDDSDDPGRGDWSWEVTRDE